MEIDKFIAIMNSLYEAFYDKLSGNEGFYNRLICHGEALLANPGLNPFVKKVVEARGDIISSDREVAAFAGAFELAF